METPFRPPDCPIFQAYLIRAVEGRSPVYGCVIDAQRVPLVRADNTFRPEDLPEGRQVLRNLAKQWQAGRPLQPWLYARRREEYVVADDYFFIALIESFGVQTFGAQVLGEPLEAGLVQKTGPLPIEQVRQMLGFSK